MFSLENDKSLLENKEWNGMERLNKTYVCRTDQTEQYANIFSTSFQSQGQEMYFVAFLVSSWSANC